MKKDIGRLVLRLTGAMMVLGHGWGKLNNFADASEYFPDPLGLGASMTLVLAVFAEVFCAVAIAIGAFTRYAVWPLIATMAVAGFVVHASDPWSKKELSLLYLVCFVAIYLLGPGKYSVDSVMGKRQS